MQYAKLLCTVFCIQLVSFTFCSRLSGSFKSLPEVVFLVSFCCCCFICMFPLSHLRDCQRLGLPNSFNHQRFITFAGICRDENGRKHVCSREKVLTYFKSVLKEKLIWVAITKLSCQQELANLYDIFQTRLSIHRRACQHKIKMAVEIMWVLTIPFLILHNTTSSLSAECPWSHVFGHYVQDQRCPLTSRWPPRLQNYEFKRRDAFSFWQQKGHGGIHKADR